jgi:hypothetical protein
MNSGKKVRSNCKVDEATHFIIWIKSSGQKARAFFMPEKGIIKNEKN